MILHALEHHTCLTATNTSLLFILKNCALSDPISTNALDTLGHYHFSESCYTAKLCELRAYICFDAIFARYI